MLCISYLAWDRVTQQSMGQTVSEWLSLIVLIFLVCGFIWQPSWWTYWWTWSESSSISFLKFSLEQQLVSGDLHKLRPLASWYMAKVAQTTTSALLLPVFLNCQILPKIMDLLFDIQFCLRFWDQAIPKWLIQHVCCKRAFSTCPPASTSNIQPKSSAAGMALQAMPIIGYISLI